MAEANSMIEKGSQDLKTIEDFVNLPAGSVVNPRLLPSVDVGTLSGIRDAIFENGGLPAAPFKTKALMTASALADDKYAMVTDDTVNNGLYVKTAGVWVRSEYDPALQVAVAYDLDKLGGLYSSLFYKEEVSDILVLIDRNDREVLKVDGMGGVQLDGVQGTVQQCMQYVKDTVEPTYNANDLVDNILDIVDDRGRNVVTLQTDGGLHLHGLKGSVQDNIRELHSKEVSYTDTPSGDEVATVVEYDKDVKFAHKQYDLNSSVVDKISRASLTYKDICPTPIWGVVQDYAANIDIQNRVSIGEMRKQEDRVVIDGYDPTWREDIGVVHPYITEFASKVAGYKYWLGINPYTGANEDIEVAYIYGSNDPNLKDWELIPSFPAPFEKDPSNEDGATSGFMSDSFMTYDVKTGDLLFVWRKTLRYSQSVDSSGNKTKFALRARRFNGKVWSEIVDLVSLRPPTPNANYRSASVVYNPNDDLYYMYYGWDNGIWYMTCPYLDNSEWSSPVKCTIDSNFAIWHVEVKPIGDKLFAVYHGREGVGTSCAVSSDWVSFKSRATDLSNDEFIYKLSFLPVIEDDFTGHIKFVYTEFGGDRKLYITNSNTFNFK